MPKVLVVEVLKTALNKLATLPGVALTVLADRDGFLIESAGDLTLGADVTAAWAACLAGSCDGIGRELGKGTFQSMVVEYEDGLVFLYELDATVMLAMLLRDSAGLGQVRSSVNDAVPELLAAL